MNLKVLNKIAHGVVSSPKSGKDSGRDGEVCEDALKQESKEMYWDCCNELTGAGRC